MKKELQKTLHSVFLFALLSFATASYSQIGSLDPTFDPDEGPDFYVNATLPLPNGKIIIGGSFSEYNAISRKGIARINADGTLDTSFNPGTGIPIVTGVVSFGINALKELPDGKIIIAGNFESYNDIPKRNMARLNADGSLDTSFTLDSRITSIIRAITLQPDGKMIITGSISVNGFKKGIARINADGTLDETFTSNLTNLIAHAPDFYTAVLLSDGKILIGGTIGRTSSVFTMVERLNADGSKDTSFTSITYTTSAPNISNGVVNSLALQPDGKIIVGGGFSYLAGNVTKRNIMRFNADGTYDASFNTGSGTGISSINRIHAIKIVPDGKMIIAGLFTTYNGISRNGLARLNADGTLDTSFAVGTGFEFNSVNSVPSVQDMKLLDDGNILVAGNFTLYNGVTRNRIAKISTRTIIVNSISATGPFCAGATFNLNYTPVGTYNAGNIFTAQLSDASGDFSNPTNIGTLASEIAGTINVTLPQNSVSGTGYKIRVISAAPFATGDIFTTNIAINVTESPTAAAQTFCGTATVNDLQAIISENATEKWYETATSSEVLLPTANLASGNYYVSQTLNGCESARIAVAVTINPEITPNFAQIPAFCSGSTAPTLALISPNGVSGTWLPATVSNTENATYTFTPNANQCATSQTLEVIINEIMTPNFAVIPAFCSGSTAPVLALISPNGINGTWSPATVSNTENASYVFTPNANQCAMTQTLTVTVNTTLPPTGTATQDFSTNDTLEDFVVVGQNIKWYDAPNGGNELLPSQLIVNGTIYYVSQTLNGCESLLRLEITAGENLKTDSFDSAKLKYYPNPANDILNVEYSKTIAAIKIYNIVGQQVLMENPDNTIAKINLSSLISGTYFMTINSEENSKTVKIIKK